MRSVMTHAFSQVPAAEIQRSSFDRSHGYKTTFDAAYLIPVFVDEVLPGDTFNLNMHAFARLATPLKPFMDNMFLDSFFFFIPNRLLWDNWQRMNGEQDNPADSTAYTTPQIEIPNGSGGIGVGSIYDYMGIRPDVDTFFIAAWWLRAYNLVWNQWFRDQNLQNSVPINTGNGPDNLSDYTLLRRGKRHDYFTSCLPWPQKGPAVSIPLGTQAPLFFQNFLVTDVEGLAGYGKVNMDNTTGALSAVSPPGGGGNQNVELTWDSATPGLIPGAYADLSAATAATINALRLSFQVQKLYERDARGGTRYTEIIKAHFGVTSPDARLQRPEYLGGGSTPVNVNPIAQTAPQQGSGVTTPQGNLAAFGTAAISGHGFTKSFTEHGVIIGLVSARADLTYQQGLNRMWSRTTRFDYYWPALAHIGEQAVLNREIFLQNGGGTNTDVFGYQEAWAEYRYKPSMITGQFRSDAAQSLDVWHLSQDFSTPPALNSDFIREDPPVDRVIAVTSEPHFIFDAYFQLKCARPMPVYSVPGLIDHL